LVQAVEALGIKGQMDRTDDLKKSIVGFVCVREVDIKPDILRLSPQKLGI